MSANNNIDLSKYRGVLETWSLIGRKIFTVTKEPIDLKWNDRVRDNDPTRTIAPIMKHMINAIEIFAVEVVPSGDGVNYLIQLNKDISLQFKLVPAKFKEVTNQSVIEALEQSDAKNKILGKEPIMFTDLLRLTEVVNRMNAGELEKAEKIAEDAINQAKGLKEFNNMNAKLCDEYYDELGTPILDGSVKN